MDPRTSIGTTVLIGTHTDEEEKRKNSPPVALSLEKVVSNCSDWPLQGVPSLSSSIPDWTVSALIHSDGRCLQPLIRSTAATTSNRPSPASTGVYCAQHFGSYRRLEPARSHAPVKIPVRFIAATHTYIPRAPGTSFARQLLVSVVERWLRIVAH